MSKFLFKNCNSYYLFNRDDRSGVLLTENRFQPAGYIYTRLHNMYENYKLNQLLLQRIRRKECV